MKITKRVLAGALALISVFAFTACGGNSNSSTASSSEESFDWSGDEVSIADLDDSDLSDKADISGQTIVWLGVYDLNPTKSNPDRSVALTLFEDTYGGKIEYVNTTAETMFDDLANRIIGGDPVDMFDYQWSAIPYGVSKKQYQPLDDYIDLDDPLWADMKEFADSMEYNDKHYVIPISTAPSAMITYSRALMEEEGLDDPYELYESGEWNWGTFIDMMKTFVGNAPDGQARYGINGWWGHLMLQSSGSPIVKYEDGKFINNITDPLIEQAETSMEEIAKLGLFDATWKGSFPEDKSTLFYGMGNWTLKESNKKNPDGDIFAVPFPKPESLDTYYTSADINAYMLVANSDKGDAVARYIECERIAATKDEYKEAAKEKFMATGEWTEEQYDFINSWSDASSNTQPFFDFGYGMGSRMYGDGDYTYETRGVMNNLTDALLKNEEGAPKTWAELREANASIIDQEIAAFNK